MGRRTFAGMVSGPIERRRPALQDWIRLARPRHWIKNAFVIVPVPFAVVAGRAELDLIVFTAGLLGFCLLNSAVYTFNDVLDAEMDRVNPRNRDRPVASGVVSVPGACVFAALLGVLGFAFLALTAEVTALALGLIYAGVNVAYSMGAKHVPLVDVFLLASGFVIRILLGCALVAAAPSSWLLACGSALALFLSFAKRRAELRAVEAVTHRPALAGYTIGFLDQAMSICAGVTLVSYALYSLEGPFFMEGRELAAMPFVAFAVLHYLRLAYVQDAGQSPVELALRSLPLQICTLGWMLATAWSLGLF